MPIDRDPPPSSVLFTPAELQFYTHWISLHRRDTDNAEAANLVPSAIEYADFNKWLAEQRSQSVPPTSPSPSSSQNLISPTSPASLSASSRTQKCRHALHPGNENEVNYCPPCLVHMHQNIIFALYDKWKAIGGPWRTENLGTPEAQTKYNDTNRA
jgi:hypothetical protein